MSATKEELEKYRNELAKIATNLGLQGRGRLEERILQACTERVAQIAGRLKPDRLSDLLDCVALELGLRIVEVGDQADIDRLLKEIPPTTEPALARIKHEFDEKTDAMVVRRISHKNWEPPYLAVINAMGWHRARRYFSKWHEIGHLLAEGQQLDFAFRKTPYVAGERPEPLEKIVDKIAGSLAFYPPIFRPALEQVLGADREMTFDAVQKVRAEIIPEASFEATTMACMEATDRPMLYVRATLAHKKTEARVLDMPDLFPETRQVPEKKLRVSKAIANTAARTLGLRLFRHMSVPGGSLVEQAFLKQADVSGIEELALWPCDPRAKRASLKVESRFQQDSVTALLTLRDS